MQGSEKVYRQHHNKRGNGFAILLDQRGSFLKRHIGQGKKVLDIGCRDGQLTSTYKNGNLVTGADIDSDALSRAKSQFGIDIVHVDLNGEWPFAKKTFDVVVACEFLEHIYFPEVVLEKISDVLKDGGLLVGSIPHAYSFQSRIKFLLGLKKGTPLEDPTHINHFSHREFKKILEKKYETIEFETYVPKRYKLLSTIFPYAFAHDLMFVAKNKTA